MTWHLRRAQQPIHTTQLPGLKTRVPVDLNQPETIVDLLTLSDQLQAGLALQEALTRYDLVRLGALAQQVRTGIGELAYQATVATAKVSLLGASLQALKDSGKV